MSPSVYPIHSFLLGLDTYLSTFTTGRAYYSQLIYCPLLQSLLEFCVCSLIRYAIPCVFSSFGNHVDGEELAGRFALLVFLVSCDCCCSETLLRGAVGWSALCDCGISKSYSLYFLTAWLDGRSRRYNNLELD